MKTISPAFQEKFNAWIDRGLSTAVPESVVAFCFNLAEPWCVELVGADRYAGDDSDWVCPPEAFRAKTKKFGLPVSEIGANWQAVLEAVTSMVSAYLSRPSAGSERLQNAIAVVVGFVDGDLHKVWPA